jgi:hypothetical protein
MRSSIEDGPLESEEEVNYVHVDQSNMLISWQSSISSG